jgi:RNA polymerase sigma-70 factor, ECF subfamily
LNASGPNDHLVVTQKTETESNFETMPPRSNDDRNETFLCVLRAMRGDDQAFEWLIDQFDQRLLYYARRMIADQHRSRDVVQETWICAFRTIRRLRDPLAFQSWLYRIAHGYVVKEFRSQYRRREEDVVEEVVDDSTHEFELRADQAASIHTAMAELSPPHREILLLRFMEDFSIDEIAATLEMPSGSVKSRLHHAKLALRRILERTMSSDK